MSTTTSTSQSRTDFWKTQITQWQASGLKQRAYCRQHKLDYHRFGYWKRKLHTHTKAKPKPKNRSSFVPVVARQQTSVASKLSLHLPNGLTLRGIDAGNITTVQKLLGAYL